MIIGGVEIKRNQEKSDVNPYYISALKREIRQTINALPFATVVKISESSYTDSLYFTTQFEGVEETFLVSIRTHQPKKVTGETFLFYIDSFKTFWDLQYKIQLELIRRYNSKARELGLKEYDLPKFKKRQRKKKSKRNKYV